MLHKLVCMYRHINRKYYRNIEYKRKVLRYRARLNTTLKRDRDGRIDKIIP